MAELQIKVEHFPARCEICHQSDRFNPKKNHCSRCSKLRETATGDKSRTRINLSNFIKVIRMIGDLLSVVFVFSFCLSIGFFVGALLGGLSGFLIYPLLKQEPLLSFLLHYLWIIICALVGTIYGGYIGFKIVTKPSQIDKVNQSHNEMHRDNQPYWADSKNRYA